MQWTLSYQTITGGVPGAVVTKTLEAWGVSQPVLTFEHPLNDAASWVMARQSDFAAAIQLPPGSTGLGHRIWFTSPDGVVRFVGMVVNPGRVAGGDSQLTRYQAVGIVGHLLKRTGYQQAKQARLYPAPALSTVYDPLVLLGMASDGTYQTTGEQLEDIFTYAADAVNDAGHVFTHDATGFPAVDILLEQAESITCYDAVLKMLAHSPDYVAWVDYSTLDVDDLPEPTIRIKSRASMAAVSRSWRSMSTQLTPAYDRLFRAVCINYQRVVQVDNASNVEVQQDIYPATLDGNPTTGRELGVLVATVNLQGGTYQNLTTNIRAETINAAHALDGTRVAWWLDNYPSLRSNGNEAAGLTYDGSGEVLITWLEDGEEYFWHRSMNDTQLDGVGTASAYFTASGGTAALRGTPGAKVTAFVGRITIPQASVVRYGNEGYPRRLLPGSGGVASWMSKGAEQERIEAVATITDDTGTREETLAVELLATEADSGTFSTQLTLADGEPVPANLAQNYYNAVSVLHHQGGASFAEQRHTFSIGLGNVLNITGAEVGLTTARLMIWRCELDIFAGRTSLDFGDPATLGIGDFMDRLRALRRRRLTVVPSSFTSGQPQGSGGSAVATLPNQNPVDRPAKATKSRSVMLMQSSDPGVTQTARMDLAALPVGSAAQWRETFGTNVIDGVCTLQRCYVLRTDWETV